MEITANIIQTVAANSNVLFTETPIAGNCAILHRDGSGTVKLRGLSNGQCRSRFRISFNGNIAQASGSIQEIDIAIAADGESLGAGTMVVTPAAVDEYFNVSSTIYLDVPTGCCSTISVKNITTNNISINIQNANLIVERVA